MRRFSDREKWYIRTLCDATRNPRSSYLAINLIENVFYTQKVKYTVGSQDLIFYRETQQLEPGEQIAVENTILEIVLLLDFLEKNGLIRYVNDQDPIAANNPITIGERVYDNTIAIVKQTAPIVVEQLTQAASHRVLVGQTLRELVANDFKSYEDMSLDESKKQTKYARGAVIIAIVAPFVTFCVNQCFTQHVVVDECHPVEKEYKMQQPTSNKDSVAVTIKTNETSIIQSGDKTTQGKSPNKIFPK